ncbi:MAG: hypothetical protein E6559_15765 [Pantoea sp.]|uniref:hypothetical protein n=1 Tax=Pantoea septica TaxID=472695 RepID=UPI0028A95ED0|nr:hypothetical protein [Pantoea septica]MDU6441334.1 hypothetical protein [Pantoea sp.]
MLFLFKKKSEADKKLLSALRKMETLKVTADGAVSVDPYEVVKKSAFIDARYKAKKAIAK